MKRMPRTTQLALALFAAVAAGASVPATASAQIVYPTENFNSLGSLNVSLSGAIAGTGLTVTGGNIQIQTDQSNTGRGQSLFMGLGSYGQFSSGYNSTTGIATASVRSTNTFNLFAGVAYTLQFDWTRPNSASGDGPYPFSLTANLGSRSLLLNDNAGFLYGYNWQTASLTFTPSVTESGAIISFSGTGGGYSGLYLDNVSMVGVGSPTPPPTQPPTPPGTNVVPEPSTYALMLSGLAAMAVFARRRKVRA
jgi:hypothetical protein